MSIQGFSIICRTSSTFRASFEAAPTTHLPCDGRYAEENGYYHERLYIPDDYQSDHPAIDVRF